MKWKPYSYLLSGAYAIWFTNPYFGFFHGIQELKSYYNPNFFPLFPSLTQMASQSPIPFPILPNAFNFLTIKLDHTNHPLWQAQMLPMLRSRNHVSIMDRTSKCHTFIFKGCRWQSNDVNLQFDTWIQQDITVMSWINFFIHSIVLVVLIGKTSSHSTWITLHDRYASQSMGCLL